MVRGNVNLPRVCFVLGRALKGAPVYLTAIIEREGSVFVALCPELDVASQGDSIEEATRNLREAVELFLECAEPAEIEERRRGEVYVTHFEASRGAA